MDRRQLRALLILLLTSAIWGFAFAAQREASKYLEPFSFGASRFLLGAAALYPIARLRDKKNGLKPINRRDMLSGTIVGAVLFVASTLQQKGIGMTSAGQAGFLSAMYVVLVPVIGAFFGRKTGRTTWLSLLLSVPALYLLCMKDEGFSLGEGDAWLLSSAIFWALHILVTDRLVKTSDPTHLCVAQFLSCGLLNLIAALLFEHTSISALVNALFPILYVGVCSTAVAYTLQAVGQRDAKPAHAALVLSMESVFSVIGGALFLGEQMGGGALVGCALMLSAVILSQLGTKDKGESLDV